MQNDSVGYLVFILSSPVVGLIISSYWLFRYKKIDYTSFLLYLLLFSLSLFSFSIGLAFTGLYLKWPHLWRLFSALAYLNAPLCFLFFRVILTNRQQFKRTDALVAVPALIHFINMLPFLLSGKAAKLEAVKMVMRDGNTFILEIEGFLLPGLNAWLRAFISFSMIIGLVFLLLGAAHHFNRGEGRLNTHDRRLYSWLWMFTVLFAISIFLVLFQFTFTFIPGWTMLHIIPMVTTFCLIFILISLLFFPGITKGFKHPLSPSELFF